MEAAVPAPELPSSSQYVVLPRVHPALSLGALVGTSQEDEPFLSSGQTSSIDLMRSKRFHTARSHRLFPLRAVGKDDISTELVESDYMARLMDDRLSSIFF